MPSFKADLPTSVDRQPDHRLTAAAAARGQAPSVEAAMLLKRYGTHTAVDGVSFRVRRGEVLALLGPNGAGKTTTVELLLGLRRADAGQARILGLDPAAAREARLLRPSLGVMLQDGSVPSWLRVREAIRLHASFYANPADQGELMTQLGLGGVAGRPVRRLSGGERRRLLLALALVGRPEVLFLDEPTAGMDPVGRADTWALVSELTRAGTSVLLTTQLLEEAEQIADRVALLAGGRLVGLDTPERLGRTADREITFRTAAPVDPAALQEVLRAPVEADTRGWRVRGVATPELVAQLTGWLAERKILVEELRTGGGLEAAFFALHRDRDAIRRDTSGRETSSTGAYQPGGRPPGGASELPVIGEEEQLPPGPPEAVTIAARQAAVDRRSPERAALAAPAGGQRAAPLWRMVAAQLRAELTLALRRGESVLLTLVLPPALLAFFTLVPVIPIDGDPVGALLPGLTALALLSAGMVSLSIATAFERQQGALRLLAVTPLPRRGWMTAKLGALVVVELVQLALLAGVALALGWQPPVTAWLALPLAAVGTAAFAGLGLLLAGRLRAEAVLALANGLYLMLVLGGGMVIPADVLPGAAGTLAGFLPTGALTTTLRAVLTDGALPPVGPAAILAGWAVLLPAAAANAFRWGDER